MPTNFQWKASSISGNKKPENDDAWLIFSAGMNGSSTLPPSGKFTNENKDIIFAVSDGMGGGNAGHLASNLILSNLSNIIPSTFKAAAQGFRPDYLEQLEIAIEKTHIAINNAGKSNPKHKGMGATLTLAWFTPENLYLAHVGDSRFYLHRNGKTAQLSEDHSFIWKKLHRQEISEYQYRNHPRKAALYQAIGGAHRTVKPQIAAIPYQQGDQFIICSDGIIDGVWEKHIHAAFLNNHSTPESIHNNLIARAIENDGSDDTTLIALSIT